LSILTVAAPVGPVVALSLFSKSGHYVYEVLRIDPAPAGIRQRQQVAPESPFPVNGFFLIQCGKQSKKKVYQW